jgi:alpha-1,2-mannosyltransferase
LRGSVFAETGKGPRRRLGVILYALAGAVFVLAVAMGYFFAGDVLERIYTPSMRVHADFDTFWASSRALLDGEDAYQTGSEFANLNPPFWVLLTVPFAFVEPLTGYRLFVALMAFLQAAALVWMLYELRPGGRVGPLAGALAVVALLVSSPLLATLALGQMYPVLTLGLVAAWAWDRRDREAASGFALGLVVALKPSLAPVLLWPLVRRRWGALGAAVVAGTTATLAGAIVVGRGAALGWVDLMLGTTANPYWDNASLPAAAARLFTEHEYGEPLAMLPGLVPVFGLAGVALVLVTAYRARRGSEWALWALAAAALLASPIAWHNYLLLLAPGVLLLLGRGRAGVAAVLITLQLIPPQWPLLWQENEPAAQTVGPALAALALSLYLFILLAHWAAFFTASGEDPEEATVASRTEEAYR